MCQSAGLSALVFNCNSCCRIGTIGSAVLYNFDVMGATDSACTEVFLLMPFGPCTKKKVGFYYVEINRGELI